MVFERKKAERTNTAHVYAGSSLQHRKLLLTAFAYVCM